MCDKIIFDQLILSYIASERYSTTVLFRCSCLHTLFNVSGLVDAPDTCLPQPLTVQDFPKIYVNIYIFVCICNYVYLILTNTTQAGCDYIYLQTDEKSTYLEYRLVSCHWNSDLLDVLIHQRVPLTESRLHLQSYSHCFWRKSIFVCVGHYWYTNNIACLRCKLISCIILTCCIHAQLYRLFQIYSNLSFATSSGHHTPLEGCLSI